MNGVTETELVEQARDAASAGDWPRAYGLLVRADQHSRLGVDELGLLGEVAYAAGHLDVTIEAWERAHAEAVRAGDPLAAADAATRIALHLLMDTALMARSEAGSNERSDCSRGTTTLRRMPGSR